MLPDGLKRDQKLADLLVIPPTKGVFNGIPGVPEVDDVNIARSGIEKNYQAFSFHSLADVSLYEKLLKEGFDLISKALSQQGQIFVDTKFEFGYVAQQGGQETLTYIDEVLLD
ncbi:MAG: phosphoribosylaminoimidazolesuccinocarboxamide synthase [Candidatus Endonucleobacter sp. (ex Gigantidas childressi)]|nr:phosphoribosylaminoimidazolesuccinocarboxamide synthase [Candidatus Endonucleobacter sp. (ex Gigantidas childressi)]